MRTEGFVRGVGWIARRELPSQEALWASRAKMGLLPTSCGRATLHISLARLISRARLISQARLTVDLGALSGVASGALFSVASRALFRSMFVHLAGR